MNISLDPVSFDEKPVLRQLMELYLYDFSEFEENDLSEQGHFGYNYLDCYWYEEGRHPFFVRVDGKLAGFVLVSKYCFLVKEKNRRSMSEFFILAVDIDILEGILSIIKLTLEVVDFCHIYL